MRALFIALLVAITPSSAALAQSSVVQRLQHATVQVVVGRGLASGFVVGDERWILTTLCTVDEALRPGGGAITVRFPSGTTRHARILRFDVSHDLALLEVEGPRMPIAALELGADARPSTGTPVVAYGTAFAHAGTLTHGLVTGQRAGTDEHAPGTPDLVLTDAPLGAGSAGSPLVDARGRVIAISVANEAADPRIGVAIPVAYARALVDDVRASRGRHGPPPPPDLAELGIVAEDGLEAVHVLHVTAGSPADRAGIGGTDAPMRIGFLRGVPVGYYVTALAGTPTPTVDALRAALATVVRGQPFEVRVRLQAAPSAPSTLVRVTLDPLP